MEKFEYDGRHLMIDAIASNTQKLIKPEYAIQFLEQIVEEIDMTMILPPITVKFPHAVCEMKRILNKLNAEGLSESLTARQISHDLDSRKEQAYGYSTFVMIAESHLSIHTFPELNYISFDCYSCKYFDTKVVESILHENFNIKKLTSQTVKRLIPKI
jgi:S-adenosylmethionine decarboxylase